MLPELAAALRILASNRSESIGSDESDAKRPRTPTNATFPRTELAGNDDTPLPTRNDAPMGIHPVEFRVINIESTKEEETSLGHHLRYYKNVIVNFLLAVGILPTRGLRKDIRCHHCQQICVQLGPMNGACSSKNICVHIGKLFSTNTNVACNAFTCIEGR